MAVMSLSSRQASDRFERNLYQHSKIVVANAYDHPSQRVIHFAYVIFRLIAPERRSPESNASSDCTRMVGCCRAR